MLSFHQLFRGRDDVYGRYVIKDRVKGKVQGQAWTEKGVVTEQLYQDHLNGKAGLGIVPITRKSVCYWGAIDVDDYEIDLLQLEIRIRETPLVLCRTKSGGAHLYLFAKKEPFPAIVLRQKLSEFAMSIGYPSSEIFPKQDKLEREDEIGNWINLPYFDRERTVRYAIKEGRALDLEEFLQYAEEKAIIEDDLIKIEIKLPDDFADGPPCLQHLANIGISSGHKDLGLFNLAVYCKLKYGDEWENELEAMNHKYVHPPAKASTIIKVIKPHRKKDYFYTCGKDPIGSYCNKDVCRIREYGIGHGEDSPSLMMGCLTKITTVPPIWYLNVEGERLEFLTQELLDQGRFRRICFETVHKIPRRMKDKDWDRLMQEKLDNLEIVNAPEDAGPAGQFYYLLKMFCTERAIARNKGELLQQKPWIYKDRVYFQSPALLSFLSAQKFKEQKPSKIYSWIREIGGEPKSISVKGKAIRVWSVPEYEDRQTEDFDVPKIDKPGF